MRLAGGRCIHIPLAAPHFRYDWERVRYPINEGPVVLWRAGRLFLVYSASDTGTPDYALGMLTHVGGLPPTPA